MEKAFIQLKMSTVIPSRCQAKACVGGRPSSARSSPSWFGRGSSIRRIAGSISSHVLRSHPDCSDLTYASDHEQSSSAFFGAFDTDSEVLEWPGEPSPQATPTTRALFLLPRSFSIPAGGFSDDLDTPSRPHVLASDARHHDHALGPRRARFHGRGGGNRRVGFRPWIEQDGSIRSILFRYDGYHHLRPMAKTRRGKRTTGQRGDTRHRCQGGTRRVVRVAVDGEQEESNTVLWHVQK